MLLFSVIPKGEPTHSLLSLTDFPDKMNQFGQFLQSIQTRIDKATKAASTSPEIALIMKRSMLNEINEKRNQIEQIDRMIREVLQSGTRISKEDRVELELHLYNCDTFRDLSDSVIRQISEQIKQ